MEGSRYDDRRGDSGEGPHAAAGKAACGAELYRAPAVPHAGERAAQTPTGALEGSGRLDYRRRHLRNAAGDVGQLSAGRRLKPGLVVDTHAALWYLADDPALSVRVAAALDAITSDGCAMHRAPAAEDSSTPLPHTILPYFGGRPPRPPWALRIRQPVSCG